MKQTEAERRAAANRGRSRETTADIAARCLSRDEEGRRWATFPNHFGVVSKKPIDISHLDRHPGLRDAFAFGYVVHCLGMQRADSRYGFNQVLKSGFLRFIAPRTTLGFGIGDVTEATLKDFKAWLDDEQSDGHLPSEESRKKQIVVVQSLLGKLMTDATWSARLSPELKLLERLYRGSKRKSEHTKVLDDASLELLYVSSADDCEATIRFVEAQDVALEKLISADEVVEPEAIRGDPLRCAAFLAHEFGHPPNWYAITRKVRLARNMDEALFRAACRILYPDLAELLPFVLLLTTLLALNPGVVLNMEQHDYEADSFAGRPRIRVFPYKPRKHGRHRNSILATDDYDNPARILSFLERRTARIREIVGRPEFGTRVFLRHCGQAKGIALEQSDRVWREGMHAFCERHGLQYFTLRQIRPTTLDLVHELTGGNIMATQQAAGHETPDTTFESYTSEAMERRDEEMLGAGINQLWRFVGSGGKVDATERDRLNADLGAATPGFSCADPYDSPFVRMKGSLCTAYGSCPICPLAMIDTSSPHAYAYQLELLARIDEAQTVLGPPWLGRWAPVKERLLTRCLSAFPRETIMAAEAVSIPRLPEVD